jgi:catechol 2,3-dioxygenase
MNTEVIVDPKLQHVGLTAANLDAMLDWYRKVLGMAVNHRSALGGPQNGRSFSAVFVSNDEVHHCMVFFGMPGLVADADKSRHARVQHIAFEYGTLDELLGTYARLKGLGILPVQAADFGLGTAFYYEDPDKNTVELNINNYGNEWTATERIRTSLPSQVFIDPDKMLAARKAGASPWEVHERAAAGEFVPAKPWPVPSEWSGLGVRP